MTLSVIDEAPYGKFHRKLLLLSSGGPFLDGYLLGIIGIVGLAIHQQLSLDPVEFGLVGAAALIGLFFGGFAGRLTDIIGRKLMYTLDLAALAIGSVLCMFVQEAWQLIVLRLFIGIAIGADYPIATAMLSEWLPRKQRGRAMGIMITWMSIGALVAAVAGFVFLQTLGDDAWRWALGSAALPAVLILIARHGTPESPRWLIANGRRAEARENIANAIGRDCSEAELDVLAAHETSTSKGGFAAVFKGQYRKRFLFVVTFWTCAVTPAFALLSFGPTILDAFGLSESMFGAVLIIGMFLLGMVPALFLIDRIGRRPLVIWSFVLMLAAMAVLGFTPAAAPVVVVACFCIYALASGGPTILELAYPNELFPTEIRATAVGLGTSVTRIGAAAGTYFVPYSLTTLGLTPTILMATGLTAIGLLVCILWAPETKGQTLSEAAGSPAPEIRSPESTNA